MAAYRRMDGCRPTACTPGSAPGPTLGNEYGSTLPFYSNQEHGKDSVMEILKKRYDHISD